MLSGFDAKPLKRETRRLSERAGVDVGLREDLAASSGASLVGFLPAGTGAVARTVQDKLREIVSVKDFGAVGDGVTDDRAAIQACEDYLNARGGGTMLLPDGTYIIGGSGVSINGREYGLLLKSNVTWRGQSKYGATLKCKAGADIDLINTDRTAAQSNIGLYDLTLDGNEGNQGAAPANGFNLWAFEITGFELKNIHSKNPASWGLRVEQCDGVQYDGITCGHSAETNADGIHFVDTINVTGGSIKIYTEGDDGFIIEALSRDVYNYSLDGILVECPTSAIASGKRGLLLLADPNVVTGARSIYNINVGEAVLYNCVGQAVLLQGANYYDVHINAVAKGCGYGLYLIPGTATYPGSIRGCSFKMLISESVNESIQVLETNGTVTDNDIDVRVVNPGNGKSGALLRGSYWQGTLTLDYNPYATKTLYSTGISIYGSNNNLNVAAKGADKNLVLQGTASNNNLKLGTLSGGVTNDLEIAAGATGNRFSGGRIAGAIVNAGGSTNKFDNVGGATTYGTANLNMATEADGTCLLAHGLNGTPTFVQLTLRTNTGITENVLSVDATNIDVELRNSAGALVTVGTYSVYYEARL